MGASSRQRSASDLRRCQEAGVRAVSISRRAGSKGPIHSEGTLGKNYGSRTEIAMEGTRRRVPGADGAAPSKFRKILKPKRHGDRLGLIVRSSGIKRFVAAVSDCRN